MQLSSVNTVINNLKRTWGIIRSLAGMGDQETRIDSLVINGERIADSVIMANKFNNYFTGIAQSLAEKFLFLLLPLRNT